MIHVRYTVAPPGYVSSVFGLGRLGRPLLLLGMKPAATPEPEAARPS